MIERRPNLVHRRLWTWALLFAAGSFCSPAFGHTFSITVVDAVLTKEGTYRIDVTVDLDPLALEASPTTDPSVLVAELKALPAEQFERAVQRAKQTILHRVRVRFDGKEVEPEISFPEHGTGTTEATHPTVLGIKARLTGRVPKGAKKFVFGASRTFPLVHLTIHDEARGRRVDQMLGPSEDSTPYVLGEGSLPSGVWSVATRYLLLGFEHIVPKGLDHILFVLGLFLLSSRLPPLLWQVTAFTVAHSLTLGLAIYGVVALPPALVEPLIALSISYVAFENALTSKLHAWRPVIVFMFGLLHGLGFASVLKELGLERERFLTALISFNVGVELGQLAVIGCAFLIVGWFRDKPWFRKAVVIPASVLIGLVGLYWAVTRAMEA